MRPPTHAILRDRHGGLWFHDGTDWVCHERGIFHRTWESLMEKRGPIDVFIHRTREDTA